MNSLIIAALLLVLLGLAYQTGWARGGSLAMAGGVKVHSRPQYHASYVAIWTLVPALLVLLLWGVFGAAITLNYTRSLIPPDVLAGLGYLNVRDDRAFELSDLGEALRARLA